MSAAEATGAPRFTPFAPGRTTPKPSPRPRPERAEQPPLRVVPTPEPTADTEPAVEPAAAPKARRIDWAAAGGRTSSAGRILYRDLVDAWVWKDTPPALRDIWAKAKTPPVDHPLLKFGWWAWMFPVAVPATAIGYTIIWTQQHPLRGILVDTATAIAIAIQVWG